MLTKSNSHILAYITAIMCDFVGISSNNDSYLVCSSSKESLLSTIYGLWGLVLIFGIVNTTYILYYYYDRALYNRTLKQEEMMEMKGNNDLDKSPNNDEKRKSKENSFDARRNSGSKSSKNIQVSTSAKKRKKWNDAVNVFPLFYLLHSTSNIAFALIKINDPLNAIVASSFSVTLLLGFVTIGMLSGVTIYLDVYSKFLIGYAQLMSPKVKDHVKSQFTFVLKYSKLIHIPVFVFGMFPLLSVLQKEHGGLDVQKSASVHFFGIGVVSIVLAYWIIIKALFTLIFEIEKYLQNRQVVENEDQLGKERAEILMSLIWKLKAASKVMCGAAFIEIVSYFSFGFRDITVYSVYQIPIVQFAELLANGMMVFTVKNFSSKQERSRVYNNNNVGDNNQRKTNSKDESSKQGSRAIDATATGNKTEPGSSIVSPLSIALSPHALGESSIVVNSNNQDIED